MNWVVRTNILQVNWANNMVKRIGMQYTERLECMPIAYMWIGYGSGRGGDTLTLSPPLRS